MLPLLWMPRILRPQVIGEYVRSKLTLTDDYHLNVPAGRTFRRRSRPRQPCYLPSRELLQRQRTNLERLLFRYPKGADLNGKKNIKKTTKKTTKKKNAKRDITKWAILSYRYRIMESDALTHAPTPEHGLCSLYSIQETGLR